MQPREFGMDPQKKEIFISNPDLVSDLDVKTQTQISSIKKKKNN